MKMADLPEQAIEQIKSYRYDCIIEKHEGPERWESVLRFYDPEFVRIAGHDVLLPVGRKHLPNITILRVIESADGQSLTLFLKDTTYVREPEDEMFGASFMAVCDKLPGQPFFLAVVYHEWFIVENPER